MPELLNPNELSRVAASAPVTEDHSGLLNALHARYPDAQIRLVAERDGRSWAPGIVDGEGNRITTDLVSWMKQEMAAAGEDARAVWRKHKDSGLVRTEWAGRVLYLAAPFGADPDAFQQIEITCGDNTTKKYLFDSSCPPEDLQDLVSGPCFVFADCERKALSPPEYFFESMTNIRRFLRDLVQVDKASRLAQLPEMETHRIRIQEITPGPNGGNISYDIPFLQLCPDWLDRVPPAYRLFQDWQESSAGRVGRFCDHWYVQTNDWKGSPTGRRMYLCPQWADADGGLELPEIYPKQGASPYGVIDSLLAFDRQAGYPFAWYFYMLHGNRVGNAAGSIVAEAIRGGRVKPFPECDEKVLLRWDKERYGF